MGRGSAGSSGALPGDRLTIPLPIETERLLIRAFEAADVDAMAEVYGDPEVMQHVSVGVLDRVDEVAVCLLGVLARRALVGAELLAALLEQVRLVLHEEVELAGDHVAERIAAESHARSRARRR